MKYEYACGLCDKKAFGSNDGVAPRYLTLDDEEEFNFLICETCVNGLRKKHYEFNHALNKEMKRAEKERNKEYRALERDKEFMESMGLQPKEGFKEWITKHITPLAGIGKNQKK